MTFEQRCRRSEGTKHADIWERADVACYNLERNTDTDISNPYGRKSKSKAVEAGTYP